MVLITSTSKLRARWQRHCNSLSVGRPHRQIRSMIKRQFVRQQYVDFLNREPDGPAGTSGLTTLPSVAIRPVVQRHRPRRSASAGSERRPAPPSSSRRSFKTPATLCCGFIAAHWAAFPSSAVQYPPDNSKDEFTRDHAQRFGRNSGQQPTRSGSNQCQQAGFCKSVCWPGGVPGNLRCVG